MARMMIYLVILLSSMPLFAAGTMPSGQYWQCAVSDGDHKEWMANSSYQLTAINKAYDACKKESQNPESCKASKEACDAYLDGYMVSPIWQCTALDFYANAFKSNVYKKKYDAALAAQAYCQDNSDSPDSCYVRLFGCENLNKRT